MVGLASGQPEVATQTDFSIILCMVGPASLGVRACGSSRLSSAVLPLQRGCVWKLQKRMQLAELESAVDPTPLLKSRGLGHNERIQVPIENSAWSRQIRGLLS